MGDFGFLPGRAAILHTRHREVAVVRPCSRIPCGGCVRPTGKIAKVTQNRPSTLTGDPVTIRVTVEIPSAAFDPINPEVTIMVPEELIQYPITVEAG